MKRKITVEVCCASLDDALAAQKGGADRIELNSALALGGLTPSAGLLAECKAALKIPIIAMVRPRTGGFCYTENEAKTTYRDAQILLQNGADGIAFGFLTPDGDVDIVRCKQMLTVIGKKEAVFHRAIDVASDSFSALQVLIELGVKRVLTSGRQVYAIDGAQCIRAMKERAANTIEILACGKIRANNVQEVLRLTGCEQIHFARLKECSDPSARANPAVRFNAQSIPEDTYSVTDCGGVEQIIRLAKEI